MNNDSYFINNIIKIIDLCNKYNKEEIKNLFLNIKKYDKIKFINLYNITHDLYYSLLNFNNIEGDNVLKVIYEY